MESALKVILIGFLSLAGCAEADPDRRVENCRAACLDYGAVYARITDESSYYGQYNNQCWCRRGVERAEPLRIW